MKRLLPRQSGGSQNPSCPRRAPPQKWRTLRTHREPTSTGARSREFEWQTSERRIESACTARRRKAACRSKNQQALARRKPNPRRRNPDDEGRWREGEDGAQVSRVINHDSAMRLDCEAYQKAAQGFTRCQASWVLRVLTFNRVGEDGDPRSSGSNRGVRRKTYDPAADRAAWSRLGGAQRRQIGTSEVGASYR